MSYATKNIRNICFMGHGNSGKTSLAESILFTTGAIDRMGKVTDGNTVCDYDAEEIKRQITIATSVAPVNFGGCKINVLDCPGYFDFVGDVLAAIRAVETGVIFCSAKDGITVGAERSWKYLKAAGVPAMFYISKIDEEHGDYYAVLSALKDKYGASICPVMIPMSDGTGVIDLVHNTAYQTNGGKTAKVAVPAADADKVEEMRMELMEAAAVTEELMEKFLDTMELSDDEIAAGLKAGLAERSVVPVLCGAAMSNVGTEAVLQAICDYVPAPEDKSAEPTCGFIFKTVSDQYGKYSYVKVLSGSIKPDMPMVNARTGETEKLGRLYIAKGKKYTEVKELTCGDIGAIAKMDKVKTGDTLCEPRKVVKIEPIPFDEPCYSVAIAPKTRGQEDKMAQGLNRLNEEDPSFRVVNNAETHQMVVSGAGDIQIDVLVSKLKTRFGVDAELDTPRVPYREKIRKTVQKQGLDPQSVEGRKAQLQILQDEVDSYRAGGRHAGLFPEKWLPAAIIVADTPFTEQNGMLNTTAKMVRGKVEKFYADRIEYAMTPDGKQLMNEKNIKSLE